MKAQILFAFWLVFLAIFSKSYVESGGTSLEEIDEKVGNTLSTSQSDATNEAVITDETDDTDESTDVNSRSPFIIMGAYEDGHWTQQLKGKTKAFFEKVKKWFEKIWPAIKGE